MSNTFGDDAQVFLRVGESNFSTTIGTLRGVHCRHQTATSDNFFTALCNPAWCATRPLVVVAESGVAPTASADNPPASSFRSAAPSPTAKVALTPDPVDRCAHLFGTILHYLRYDRWRFPSPPPYGRDVQEYQRDVFHELTYYGYRVFPWSWVVNQPCSLLPPPTSVVVVGDALRRVNESTYTPSLDDWLTSRAPHVEAVEFAPLLEAATRHQHSASRAGSSSSRRSGSFHGFDAGSPFVVENAPPCVRPIAEWLTAFAQEFLVDAFLASSFDATCGRRSQHLVLCRPVDAIVASMLPARAVSAAAIKQMVAQSLLGHWQEQQPRQPVQQPAFPTPGFGSSLPSSGTIEPAATTAPEAATTSLDMVTKLFAYRKELSRIVYSVWRTEFGVDTPPKIAWLRFAEEDQVAAGAAALAGGYSSTAASSMSAAGESLPHMVCFGWAGAPYQWTFGTKSHHHQLAVVEVGH